MVRTNVVRVAQNHRILISTSMRKGGVAFFDLWPLMITHHHYQVIEDVLQGHHEQWLGLMWLGWLKTMLLFIGEVAFFFDLWPLIYNPSPLPSHRGQPQGPHEQWSTVG